MQLFHVDSDPNVVKAWKQLFNDVSNVVVTQGDYFDTNAAAMVSPANSFGIMDGGLDAAIRDTIGQHLQRRVQHVILERHHGELPVGCAEIIETNDQRWPQLVIAPTMRVPTTRQQLIECIHRI